MSLDDTRAALRAFAADLQRLDDTVAASLAALEHHHGELAALWRDASAQRYQRQWADVGRPLRDYLRRQAPSYRHFIELRLRQLDRYLGDG